LDATHWRNNEAKSDDFPTFAYTTAAKKPLNKIENETKLRVRCTFSKSSLNDLKSVYPEIQVV
jgi:hypothetical protein